MLGGQLQQRRDALIGFVFRKQRANQLSHAGRQRRMPLTLPRPEVALHHQRHVGGKTSHALARFGLRSRHQKGHSGLDQLMDQSGITEGGNPDHGQGRIRRRRPADDLKPLVFPTHP